MSRDLFDKRRLIEQILVQELKVHCENRNACLELNSIEGSDVGFSISAVASNQGSDAMMLVAIGAIAIVAVIAAVFIIKRRSKK
jgi:hypothetical protein